MADLDATLEVEGTRSVGGRIALADLSGLDRAVGCEVAAHHQVQDVALVGVRTGHPHGSLDHSRVHEIAHATAGVSF